MVNKRMVFNITTPFLPKPQAISRRWLRQRLTIHAVPLITLLAALAVSACGSSLPPVGEVGNVIGFAGAVAADEPRAVLIARDILSAGGSAADAAVALAFTMAVTNPSSAGIGGGGVCLVHDHKSKKTEALEFFAAADKPGPHTTRPTAVPAMPRGMYALHAKYGRLRWESLLVTPERLARDGESLSRSLANDLSKVLGPLLEDAEARKTFARSDGEALKEGDRFVQFDLAALIGKIRLRGPGDLYTGSGAQTLVDAVTAAGGSLTLEGLRATMPRWTETLQVPFGSNTAHFAPPPAAGGVAGQIWAMLISDDTYQKAAVDVRGHLVAESELRAFADRSHWMQPDGSSSTPPATLVSQERIAKMKIGLNSAHNATETTPASAFTENPAATGFVVVDAEGSAVACSLTMNNNFGAGRVAPGTGMLLAAGPNPAGRGPYALAPMLVVKHNVNEITFAATASGGPTAAASLVGVGLQTIVSGVKLGDAVAAPRAHAEINTNIVYVEQSQNKVIVEGLEKWGHKTTPVSALGRVNAVSCPEGLPAVSETCRVAIDPRGYGYAVIAGKN